MRRCKRGKNRTCYDRFTISIPENLIKLFAKMIQAGYLIKTV